MEYGKKMGDITIAQLATETAYKGGAVGIGLLGSGAVAKGIENLIKPSVLPTAPLMDKIIAWGTNVVVKGGAYMAVAKLGKGLGKELQEDVGKGILTSVVLDALVRASNDYAPKPALLTFFGIDLLGNPVNTSLTPQTNENVQRVLQENSSLRQQLNGALQRLASASPNVTVTPMQTAQSFPPDHDRQYGMMQTTPEAENRRKNYGAMTPPIEEERNRKYGAMNKAKLNFAGETDNIASAFGML